MSIVLFFGVVALVILVGLIISGLTVRHHWKKGNLPDPKNDSDQSQAPVR